MDVFEVFHAQYPDSVVQTLHLPGQVRRSHVVRTGGPDEWHVYGAQVTADDAGRAMFRWFVDGRETFSTTSSESVAALGGSDRSRPGTWRSTWPWGGDGRRPARTGGLSGWPRSVRTDLPATARWRSGAMPHRTDSSIRVPRRDERGLGARLHSGLNAAQPLQQQLQGRGNGIGIAGVRLPHLFTPVQQRQCMKDREVDPIIR